MIIHYKNLPLGALREGPQLLAEVEGELIISIRMGSIFSEKGTYYWSSQKKFRHGYHRIMTSFSMSRWISKTLRLFSFKNSRMAYG